MNSFHVLKPVLEILLSRGVSETTLASLLLFPLFALVIALSRYLVGIKGLGIFVPMVLAIVFLDIGLVAGLIFFLVVLLTISLGRYLTLGLHLHYLTRISLLLWLTSLTVLFFLLRFNGSLFSLLVLILIGENLLEVQISKGRREASKLIAESLFLAILGWFILSWDWLHQAVLAQPEMFLVLTALGNILLGRFTGLRLLEYKRFRKLLK